MRVEGTRQRILDAVEQEPGIHKSQLCRSLDLGWGTVSHHVRVLEGARMLRSVPAGRQVRLFPAAVPERQARWLSVLRDDVAVMVVDALRERPGARVTELAQSLDASRKVVGRHLAHLREAGVVQADGKWRPRYSVGRGGQAPYRPSPPTPR